MFFFLGPWSFHFPRAMTLGTRGPGDDDA
jgi:hypothetical protein